MREVEQSKEFERPSADLRNPCFVWQRWTPDEQVSEVGLKPSKVELLHVGASGDVVVGSFPFPFLCPSMLLFLRFSLPTDLAEPSCSRTSRTNAFFGILASGQSLAPWSNRQAPLASRDLIMRSLLGLSYVKPGQRDAGTECNVNLQCNQPNCSWGSCSLGTTHAGPRQVERAPRFLHRIGTTQAPIFEVSCGCGAGPVDGTSFREPPSPQKWVLLKCYVSPAFLLRSDTTRKSGENGPG